ncbi:MAG TPA: ATP-binding cassette domain-containing protein [Verrucomicrobiales bacterium]|nr:ATP-binding cassette domain-containing protein [Verrucomicrobiales bacterium]
MSGLPPVSPPAGRSLVRLDAVDAQLGGVPVLHAIAWDIRSRSRWILRGPNGSGKSTLLRLLAGSLWPTPGQHTRRVYSFDGAPSWSPALAVPHIASLSPEDQDLYFVREWNPLARDVVASGLFHCALLHQTPDPAQQEQIAALLLRLGLDPLAALPFLELSQGQQRQILLARALVRKPALLLLDEFSDGLDRVARRTFYDTLARVSSSGTALVVATHREEGIPGAAWNQAWMRQGRLDFQDSTTPAKVWTGPVASSATESPVRSPDPIIRLENVTLYRGGQVILNKAAWTIPAGSHWAVLGRNGSGKTSLFLLLAGELHAVAGGRVERFGRPSLTLAEIRRRTGFFHPELHAWLDPGTPGWAVVGGPLTGSLAAAQALNSSEALRVRRAAAVLGAEDLLLSLVSTLSYGQVRRLLLARTLAHQPELLLLDEPFDGLDLETSDRLTQVLEDARDRGATVLLSTHHDHEIPPWFQRRCRLENGRLREDRPCK